LSTWLVAGLLGLTLVVPFLFDDAKPRDAFALEVRMVSARGGHAQVYYDTGNGFNESESVQVTLQVDQEMSYRFPLPAADYRKFRFDPTTARVP